MSRACVVSSVGMFILRDSPHARRLSRSDIMPMRSSVLNSSYIKHTS